MSTATMDQWKIVCWKCQGVQRLERKAGTSAIFGRKGCLHYSADWIDYNKSFCYSLHDGIVLVVSLLTAITSDLVVMKSKWSTFCCLHGLSVVVLHCTY